MVWFGFVDAFHRKGYKMVSIPKTCKTFDGTLSINVYQLQHTGTLKIEKKHPFGNEKNFVSDFDEIQNMKSLWPKRFTHRNGVESETIFSTLMIF